MKSKCKLLSVPVVAVCAVLLAGIAAADFQTGVDFLKGEFYKDFTVDVNSGDNFTTITCTMNPQDGKPGGSFIELPGIPELRDQLVNQWGRAFTSSQGNGYVFALSNDELSDFLKDVDDGFRNVVDNNPDIIPDPNDPNNPDNPGTTTPEPTTLLVVGLGIAALVPFAGRFRRKRNENDMTP